MTIQTIWSAIFGIVLLVLGLYQLNTGKTSPLPRRPQWPSRSVRWIGTALVSGGLGMLGVATAEWVPIRTSVTSFGIIGLFGIALACLVVASRIKAWPEKS